MKYLYQLKLAFINKISYRQELLMAVITGLIVFLGQYIFWGAYYGNTLIENGAQLVGEQVINGFSFTQLLTYYLFARVMSEVVESRLGFHLSDLILSGQVSNYLLKPYTFKLWLLAEQLGQILVNLFFKLGVYLVLFLLLIGPIEFDVKRSPFFLFTLCLSFLLSFNIFYLIGQIAFVIDAANGINYALRRLIFFLAGGIIPLSFFPDSLQMILNFLPFQYMFDLPIQIILGTEKYTGSVLNEAILIQFFWLVVIWAISSWSFNRAIKFNQSVGI